jgi:vacuolar-type H+-ATPase subunit H
VASAELPVPVELTKMHMEFTPRLVKLTTLDLKLGSSDLQMDGDLRNFIPYLFDDQTVYATLNMTSGVLDANELMPELQDDESAGNRVETDSILAPPPDSLAQPARIRIPENLDFALNLQMDKLIYKETEVDDVLGNMKLREGVAYLDRLSMSVIEGEASGSGQVDTRGEYTEVEMQVKLQGADIRSAYEQFVSVERLAPMAKFCRGTAHVDVQFQSSLDATFTPLYESIYASGTMFTRGLQIHELNKFMKLTEMLKDDKFTEIAPDEVEVSFKVREGRIHFSPFDMAFESSSMTMSGSHGIDMTLDYLLDMQIAKRDLGQGANDLMNGMALLAAGAGIKIPQSDYVKVKAKIRGTFNDPKVSTDLSANLKSSGEEVIEAVEERVLEEVEKVEEQVREEVGDQAEQLISEAEAEAERLLEEARKAGEALVKEAEKQGDKLIEEAGDNAFKQIAAKRAAQELKRQAEKQSAKLIKEAEEQADELIKQARTEAERL